MTYLVNQARYKTGGGYPGGKYPRGGMSGGDDRGELSGGGGGMTGGGGGKCPRIVWHPQIVMYLEAFRSKTAYNYS